MNIKEKTKRDSFDLDYIISMVRGKWPILAATIFLGISAAFIYNKIKLPVYLVGSSIMIEQSENPATQAVSQVFEGMGISPEENSFQNKLQVLKSSPLIKKSIENLDFQVSYFKHSFFNNTELYKNSPFVVIFNQNHPQPINIRFKVEILNDKSFTIKCKGDDVVLYSFNSETPIDKLSDFKVNLSGTFGDELTSDNFNFKLVLNDNFNQEDYTSKTFSFIIHDNKSLVQKYKEELTVEPVDFETSIAVISIKSIVPEKAMSLVTSLTNEYLARDVEDKIHGSIKTIEYIDNQLGVISDSLQRAENDLQSFRTSNKVMDISVKSGRVYDQLQELERDKGAAVIRYKYYQYINEYFEKNKELSDLIAPSSMGIEDPLLNNLIQDLTGLNSERTSLLENNQGKSPYLRQIDIRIDNLKNTITENIKYIINTTEITIQDINERIGSLNGELNKLPSTERELLGYERKFNLNDAIYTYLLERRAEAQIVKASYMPGAEIIEPTDIISGGAIAPKRILNLLIGFILGLILPIITLRTKDIIENKINENTDIGKMVELPVIGQIFKNNKKVDLVVPVFPKSHIAESFRIVRTGLNYFLKHQESSVIVVTSSFAQEGKSFISVNLAATLASTDKKTILLGFDLRKPKVYERLNITNQVGISSFLSSQMQIDEVLQHTNLPKLDIITSGPIPPNPSELIATEKTKELIDYLKKEYAYIIIDTPPVGILSDTYLLMDFADLNIYVVRQNQTPRREFLTIINDLKAKKIKNICFAINDIPLMKKSRYGYDYYEK